MPRVSETKPTVTVRKKSKKQDTANVETTHQTAAGDQRWSMIQETAYLRAEKRGFEGGDPIQDWLDAEREIDAMLATQDRTPDVSTN